MEKAEFAKALAAYVHAGQTDRAGKPYIEHPLAVAAQMDTEQERIVALLHDVLEDTAVTYDTLCNLFGAEIADRVARLTHREGESYMDYVRRVGEDPVTRKVKLADLRHNMDLSRLPAVTEEDLARLAKYQQACEYLITL